MDNDKMLINSKKTWKKHPYGMLCKKREVDECRPLMKKEALYTSGICKARTVQSRICETTSRFPKQHLNV